jgi:hypothetical protein
MEGNNCKRKIKDKGKEENWEQKRGPEERRKEKEGAESRRRKSRRGNEVTVSSRSKRHRLFLL